MKYIMVIRKTIRQVATAGVTSLSSAVSFYNNFNFFQIFYATIFMCFFDESEACILILVTLFMLYFGHLWRQYGSS